MPKVKGTWLVTKHLHDKFDAVYDVSVFYDDTVDQAGVRGNAPQLIGEFSIFFIFNLSAFNFELSFPMDFILSGVLCPWNRYCTHLQ